MQLKILGGFLAIVAYMALALTCTLLLRNYGLGENYPLLLGIQLLFILLLLLLLFFFVRKYTKPFQDIDKQLDTLLSEPAAEIHLPQELNVTEQKLQSLKQTMEKRLFNAQLAEQKKNDLVTYLAHDIRTPLTPIIGYLNLLEEVKDMPDEQRQKYTRITLDKTYRLKKMINEFFEITRYSLQQIQLHKERIDLYYMLLQLTDELLPVFEKNGNTTVLQMETEDLSIYADPDKLARVFSNI